MTWFSCCHSWCWRSEELIGIRVLHGEKLIDIPLFDGDDFIGIGVLGSE